MNKMKNIKVAIQGVAGSFHELAASDYFQHKDPDLLYCDSFEQLFKLVSDEKECFGVVAIENTVAGSILPNYKMLQEYNFSVIGEIYMRIVQNLMVLPGQQLSDIKEIWSHPMALKQCSDFLKKHSNIKSVIREDTAKSAEIIKNNDLKHVAAIAGEKAANIYGLEIIKKEIETNKKNFTRFLVISSNTEIVLEKINKASICFTLDHETGSLAKVLVLLSENNLNLTKVQSNPIVGKEWEYFFYVDLLFDSYDNYKRTMDDLNDIATELLILGEYTSGEKPVIN